MQIQIYLFGGARWRLHKYDWVTSYILMSRVTHMNESCHIRMSHVPNMNEPCHKCEWVMSHIWMSRVTHMNESCHTCEWIMSQKLHRRKRIWSASRFSLFTSLIEEGRQRDSVPTLLAYAVTHLWKETVSYLGLFCEPPIRRIEGSQYRHLQVRESLWLIEYIKYWRIDLTSASSELPANVLPSM